MADTGGRPIRVDGKATRAAARPLGGAWHVPLELAGALGLAGGAGELLALETGRGRRALVRAGIGLALHGPRGGARAPHPAADQADGWVPLWALDAFGLTARVTRDACHIRTRAPVVLVHGWGSNPERGWRSPGDGLYPALLEQGYREENGSLLSVDLPVLNQQQAGGIFYDALLLRFAIDDLLEAYGAGQVHLVAHSRGGLVARAYAALFGHGALRTVITLCTPHAGLLPHNWGRWLTGHAVPLAAPDMAADSEAVARLRRLEEGLGGPAPLRVAIAAAGGDGDDDGLVSLASARAYPGAECPPAVRLQGSLPGLRLKDLARWLLESPHRAIYRDHGAARSITGWLHPFHPRRPWPEPFIAG